MLKSQFKGYNAWVISAVSETFDKIGLKPSIKYPVLNGSLECELREYVIFDGTYSEFRKEGRSVKNENFRGEAKQKFLRSRFEPTLGDEGEDDAENGTRASKSSVGKPLRRENKKFEGKTLREHLDEQRSVIRRKETTNSKYQLIGKPEMKKLMGGKRSPDIIEMIIMHEHFNTNKPKGDFKGLNFFRR
jgi:hypothetical protein